MLCLVERETFVPSQSYAVLGTPGYIRDPQRFDTGQILSALGGHAGNLMFQFAASQIVAAPLLHISMSDIPYLDTPEVRRTQTLIFPAADHLRPDTDWTDLNNYLQGVNKSLVVLGLGAVAPPDGNEAAMIAALKSAPSVMRMIDILRDRGVFVSVRGAYSQRICAALGLPDVHVLGCPSALINPDPGLGAAVARRLAYAAMPGVQARVSVSAAAPFDIAGSPDRCALEHRLLEFAMQGGGLYVQESGGALAMLATNGQWYDLSSADRRALTAVLGGQVDPLDLWAFLAKHGRFPINVADWRRDMRDQDLLLGTRVHGAMAALSVGTPGVVIGVSELTRTMHLPVLDGATVLTATDLADALRQIDFDPAAFDRWRCATAHTLVTEFDRIGLPPSDHVRHLASLHRSVRLTQQA